MLMLNGESKTMPMIVTTNAKIDISKRTHSIFLTKPSEKDLI